jgi:integrase
MRARLTALKVARITKEGFHCDHGDGAARGLYLQVSEAASGVTKSWIYRYHSPVTGKPRWMGLGPADVITLAKARELATDARLKVKLGLDPIEHRNEKRMAARIEAAKAVTFAQCTSDFLAAHAPHWRNEKHRAQWPSTLNTYAHPLIGALPVSAIDTALILKILRPIWNEKPETANRLRGRIERVLDWATAQGFRQGDNPARWKGHLDKLLPLKSKVRAVRHHPALPYTELPSFMADLRAAETMSARALEFTILTAARTSEVIGAKWSEIDLDAKVWTVPAERMKSARPHRVPLSDRAFELLDALPRDGGAFLFPGARRAKPMSNMAMLQAMKHLRPGYVPHGFRSTFSDWARDGGWPRDFVELALAHVIRDKSEAAYRRGDGLVERRKLMAAWEGYCAASPVDKFNTPFPSLPV